MAVFFGVPDWIILLATAGILLYLYASRRRNYWTNQNVTSEPFHIIFGPSSKLLFTPAHEVDRARYQKYGKLFGAFETGKVILFVAKPELVKQVMVKDFPTLPNRRDVVFNDPMLDNMMSTTPVEQWRKIRPAASPAFSTGKLRKMNHLIEDCVLGTMKHLNEVASKKEEIDPKQFFGHCTLGIIARCAFGTRLDSNPEQTNEFVTKAREAFSGRLTLRLVVFLVFPALGKLLRLGAFNRDTFLYFKRVCQSIIKNRKDQQSLSPRTKPWRSACFSSLPDKTRQPVSSPMFFIAWQSIRRFKTS